jgi:hypothetical protein
MEAHIAGDPEAIVEIDRDFKPTLRSRISEGDGEVRVSAGSEEEAKRLVERLVRRLAAQGKKIEKVQQRSAEFDSIEATVEINGTIWLRSAAKMALAALSLALPEGWLDSADAKRLQRWLWDHQPTNEDGSRAGALPGPPAEAERIAAPTSPEVRRNLLRVPALIPRG